MVVKRKSTWNVKSQDGRRTRSLPSAMRADLEKPRWPVWGSQSRSAFYLDVYLLIFMSQWMIRLLVK